jgi:hypothetical protein
MEAKSDENDEIITDCRIRPEEHSALAGNGSARRFGVCSARILGLNSDERILERHHRIPTPGTEVDNVHGWENFVPVEPGFFLLDDKLMSVLDSLDT